MTEDDKNAIRWVTLLLASPRNRNGRLVPRVSFPWEELRRHALRLNVPNGGEDTFDQARMILQAIIGDEITPLGVQS